MLDRWRRSRGAGPGSGVDGGRPSAGTPADPAPARRDAAQQTETEDIPAAVPSRGTVTADPSWLGEGDAGADAGDGTAADTAGPVDSGSGAVGHGPAAEGAAGQGSASEGSTGDGSTAVSVEVRTTAGAASGGDSAAEWPTGDGSAAQGPADHGSESPAHGGKPHAVGTGEAGPADRPRTLLTDAPRLGNLQPLPLPRLAPVDTSLPGVRADAGLLRDRWLGAASLVGQSHLNSGTTAQDAYQFTVSDDGSLLVAVVCDGLGSRALTSQLGSSLLSTLLCTAARRTTAEQLGTNPQAVLGGILGEACARLLHLRAVALPGLADGDLSSTVAFVLVPADGAGWAARIGDCAVMTLTDGVWGTVFHNAEGPLNRVTAALPHPAPADAAEYAPLPETRDTSLVLASDGLAEDVFGSPTVRTWLAQRWARRCDASAMADSLRYRRQGSHDDRTALVLWPHRTEDV